MPAALVATLAKEKGISQKEAEKRWDNAKKITQEQTDMTESDGDKYWSYVTGVFKKSMGVKSILESIFCDEVWDL